MKNLYEIKKELGLPVHSSDEAICISDITADSREVVEGSLFICLVGTHVDGHDYVKSAIEKGAKAILVSKNVDLPQGVACLFVEDTREAMQRIVPFFFDYPGKKLRMIGVTGTNGKTTVTHLIKHILDEQGYKTGLIGTIHSMIGQESYPIHNTTPDVVDLQKILARMVENGISHCIMEVSSHALVLGRVAGIEFDTAVFTNLTQDHLDFHKTIENYLEAKSLLFSSLLEDAKQFKTAVVNMDDKWGAAIMANTPAMAMSYGISGGHSLDADDVVLDGRQTSFSLFCYGEQYDVRTELAGMFNVYNVLAAIGAAIAEGVEIESVIQSLRTFKTVPGRFEIVESNKPFTVIVDYAHTPDGIKNILDTAKAIVKNKIIIVFGCGGDRDATKRPIMGKIAIEGADYVIVTSDNPRSEDPGCIVQDIEAGVMTGLTSGHAYETIIDRKEAIEKAIDMAVEGDIVLIAGKGHENYQILKNETIHFDDREVAQEALQRSK